MEIKEYLDKKQFLCRHFECYNCPMKNHKKNNHGMSCNKFEVEEPETAVAIVGEYWEENALPLMTYVNAPVPVDKDDITSLILYSINETRKQLNEVIILLNDKLE